MQANCHIRILSQIDAEKKLYNLDGNLSLDGKRARLTYLLEGSQTSIVTDEKGVTMTREGNGYLAFHFQKKGKSTGKIGLSKTESGEVDVKTESVTSKIVETDGNVKKLEIELKYALSFTGGESQKTVLRLVAEVK